MVNNIQIAIYIKKKFGWIHNFSNNDFSQKIGRPFNEILMLLRFKAIAILNVIALLALDKKF